VPGSRTAVPPISRPRPSMYRRWSGTWVDDASVCRRSASPIPPAHEKGSVRTRGRKVKRLRGPRPDAATGLAGSGETGPTSAILLHAVATGRAKPM
jgi:hypothetical protein